MIRHERGIDRSLDLIENVAEERLYITDINSVTRRSFREHEIDYNLNLALRAISDRRRAQGTTYEHIPFPDQEAGTEIRKRFDDAVTTTLRRLRDSNDRIVVNCGAGVSRSGAVTATVVGVFHELQFDEALAYVVNSRQVVDPYHSLREYGTAYIKDRIGDQK